MNKPITKICILGGGFGGCTLNIVKKESAEQFLTNIKAAYFREYGVELPHYFVEPSVGATLIA